MSIYDTSPHRRQIKEMPLSEQPQQRCQQLGTQALSSAELLSLVLGCADGLDLAHELLTTFGSLPQLARASRARLKRIKGIGEKQAARLTAVVELGRRLQAPHEGEPFRVTSPADAANYLMPILRDLEREQLWVMTLNTRNVVLDCQMIYAGSVNTSVVRIAEIFRPAIEQMAAAIIVSHNHPSSDPSPSAEDVRVTREMVKAGRLLNVEILDHLIIAGPRFKSLKEAGLGFD